MTEARLEAEWFQLKLDVDRLQQAEFEHNGQRYIARIEVESHQSALLRAVGVALPPRLKATATASEGRATPMLKPRRGRPRRSATISRFPRFGGPYQILNKTHCSTGVMNDPV
jgi:hypothetical protein